MTRPSSRRSTTSKNAQGNSTDRRRRKEWLVRTFRADRDVHPLVARTLAAGESVPRRWVESGVSLGTGEPACRCYRCGVLLTVATVSPDRIKPGCEGGTYRRDNLRPSCVPCQTKTGSELGHARRRGAMRPRLSGGVIRGPRPDSDEVVAIPSGVVRSTFPELLETLDAINASAEEGRS